MSPSATNIVFMKITQYLTDGSILNKGYLLLLNEIGCVISLGIPSIRGYLLATCGFTQKHFSNSGEELLLVGVCRLVGLTVTL